MKYFKTGALAAVSRAAALESANITFNATASPHPPRSAAAAPDPAPRAFLHISAPPGAGRRRLLQDGPAAASPASPEPLPVIKDEDALVTYRLLTRYPYYVISNVTAACAKDGLVIYDLLSENGVHLHPTVILEGKQLLTGGPAVLPLLVVAPAVAAPPPPPPLTGNHVFGVAAGCALGGVLLLATMWGIVKARRQPRRRDGDGGDVYGGGFGNKGEFVEGREPSSDSMVTFEGLGQLRSKYMQQWPGLRAGGGAAVKVDVSVPSAAAAGKRGPPDGAPAAAAAAAAAAVAAKKPAEEPKGTPRDNDARPGRDQVVAAPQPLPAAPTPAASRADAGADARALTRIQSFPLTQEDLVDSDSPTAGGGAAAAAAASAAAAGAATATAGAAPAAAAEPMGGGFGGAFRRMYSAAVDGAYLAVGRGPLERADSDAPPPLPLPDGQVQLRPAPEAPPATAAPPAADPRLDLAMWSYSSQPSSPFAGSAGSQPSSARSVRTGSYIPYAPPPLPMPPPAALPPSGAAAAAAAPGARGGAVAERVRAAHLLHRASGGSASPAARPPGGARRVEGEEGGEGGGGSAPPRRSGSM